MSKVKVSEWVSQLVSQWQGHLLSCSGQLKRKMQKKNWHIWPKRADLYGRRSDWVGWRRSKPLPSWSNKKSPTNRPAVNVLAVRPLSTKLNQNGLSLTNFLSRKTVQAESWTLCTRLYPLYISTKDCIRCTLLMWSEDTKDTNSQVDELCDQCNYEASHGEHLRMHLEESNAVKWIFCWKFYRTLSQSVVQILFLNYLNLWCKFYLWISIISIRCANFISQSQLSQFVVQMISHRANHLSDNHTSRNTQLWSKMYYFSDSLCWRSFDVKVV